MAGEVNGAVRLAQFADIADRRRILDPAYWQELNVILRS
jgi:hypothetical protein